MENLSGFEKIESFQHWESNSCFMDTYINEKTEQTLYVAHEKDGRNFLLDEDCRFKFDKEDEVSHADAIAKLEL